MSYSEDIECHIIIPAAGNGTRFQSGLPKQFHTIHGKPIIMHTFEKFVREQCVKNIVIVGPECKELFQKMEEVFHKYTNGIKNTVLTPGQSTRHRSIFQGLKCLKNILHQSGKTEHECENEIVIIHDGVRPFVTNDDIVRVVASAKKYKAAGLVKPLVSTVLKLDSEDMLEHTLDRAVHWSSEMPQAFHLGTIFSAYAKCSEYELEHGTECLHVACRYGGVHAKLLQGDPKRLWKITVESDLVPAKAFLKGGKNILMVCPDTQIEHIRSSTNKSESFQICALEDFEKYSIEGFTAFIYSLQDKNQIYSASKTLLNSLNFHHDGSSPNSVTAVFTLRIQGNVFGVDENFREDFRRIVEQMKCSGVVCHICIIRGLLYDAFNHLLLLLSSCHLQEIPSGQILYI